MRALLLAPLALLAPLVLLVAGCGSSSDRRVAASSAPPAPAVAPVPGDAAAELAVAPADAAALPDAPADAAAGHFASLAGTEAISDGFIMKDGEPCYGYELAGGLRGMECSSGVCEGIGCPGERAATSGAGAFSGTNRCAPARRTCARDRRAYCGCDGKTFYASSTCPRRRYVSEGPCPAP